MEKTNRYDRQILLPEIGAKGQEKLWRARILIVGVGGLGSPIALYLAAAGVGTLGLADDDVVSVTNLQRQVLYTEAEVGKSKALCAKRRLEALNSEIRIEAYPMRIDASNARALIGGYDIVIDGCDNFATRYLLNDTALELGKTYIYGAIQGLEGQVSVFGAGNRPYSYRDLYPNPAELEAMPPPGKEVVGVTPAIVGSVEAGEALKLVCGYGEPLIGKLWSIDLRTLQSFTIALGTP